MGALESKLYWSQTQADGTPRSFASKIMDPVGACIQPADLAPFSEIEQTEAVAIETPADPKLPDPANADPETTTDEKTISE